MKSYEEFVKELVQAETDTERCNELLTGRSQAYMDEFHKCTGSIAQGDIPFAIVALTAAKAALEEISDDKTKQVTRYLTERTRMMCFCNKHTKTE